VLDISVSTGLAVIVVGRHFTNVRRLVQGREHGLGTTGATGSSGAPG